MGDAESLLLSEASCAEGVSCEVAIAGKSLEVQVQARSTPHLHRCGET